MLTQQCQEILRKIPDPFRAGAREGLGTRLLRVRVRETCKQIIAHARTIPIYVVCGGYLPLLARLFPKTLPSMYASMGG